MEGKQSNLQNYNYEDHFNKTGIKLKQSNLQNCNYKDHFNKTELCRASMPTNMSEKDNSFLHPSLPAPHPMCLLILRKTSLESHGCRPVIPMKINDKQKAGKLPSFPAEAGCC